MFMAKFSAAMMKVATDKSEGFVVSKGASTAGRQRTVIAKEPLPPVVFWLGMCAKLLAIMAT
jgi:hypothetical protein